MKASLLAIAAIATTALGSLSPDLPFIRKPLARRNLGGVEPRELTNPDVVHNCTFRQLLDHIDPSKGIFEQRYWYNAEHWGGPGYPVFLVNGGESDASEYTYYLNNGTIMYLYAEKYKGAIVLLEHRYYGASIPFDTLTAETLQYHTVPQAIYDNKYFAEAASLPFAKKGGANADDSPWVLIGGSYPGALAAWQSVITPGVFAAHHASSAVVQAIEDFWHFFTPIEKALPSNCSTDVKRVVAMVDKVLDKGTRKEVAKMKAQFGLGSLHDDGDFAYILYQPVISWADNQTAVYEFCDYLETGGHTRKSQDWGVGRQGAWEGYTSYMQQYWNDTCAQGVCAWNAKTEAHNATHLGADRAWRWQLCNEPLGWWQVGPPKSDGKNIASSHIRPEHESRDCALYFPQTKGFKSEIEEGFTADMFNLWTGGWDADFQNVLFVDGEYDPWIEAGVSATSRPGGVVKSSKRVERYVIRKGMHVPDFDIVGGEEYRRVTKRSVEAMGRWIKEWKEKK
ncbi:putative extracellular serine carboxypeptidase [Colletotrichum sidae]|uniref:Putative extracellular serine carboxypeptidase n=1 Tax=Colletotrichum sidae TaxID=1347389 RepID=A0A4R8T9Q0_9PEZI|nr:putative extracellular serine carboxypeptidase [Colletotrichum sidae]